LKLLKESEYKPMSKEVSGVKQMLAGFIKKLRAES
jgi:hypothetical protein